MLLARLAHIRRSFKSTQLLQTLLFAGYLKDCKDISECLGHAVRAVVQDDFTRNRLLGTLQSERVVPSDRTLRRHRLT
eukprot:12568664-Alexandrium_andersonii.AAC.1